MPRQIQEAAERVRKLAKSNAPPPPPAKTGDQALRKSLAQSPTTDVQLADHGLPTGVVRNLVYSGAPEDLAQLREMVSSMSPKAQNNLMRSIMRDTQDPQKLGVDPSTGKRRPIEVTDEGKMLIDAVFNGVEPDASMVTNKPPTPGGGARLSDMAAETGLEPKPFRPASVSEDGKQLRDTPSTRGRMVAEENADGEMVRTYVDEGMDGQTRRAIERAREGLRVGPIFDDPLNTPRGSADNPRPPGRALSAGTSTPKQQSTGLMHRLAETSNAHGVTDSVRADDPLMFGVADSRQDNPSVFAPGNTGSSMNRHMTRVRPQDHSDAMRVFASLKRGDNTVPNTQFESGEDMARAFVSMNNQEGLNITPVTAGERRAATDMLQDYNYDPEFPVERLGGGAIPPGVMAARKAGPLLDQNMSSTTMDGAKTAERSLMQEQTIAVLARKFDDIFGGDGWGENYKPSTRPGTDEPVAPPRGIGDIVSTTQDPTQVPNLPGSTNQRVEPIAMSYDDMLANYEAQKAATSPIMDRGDPGQETGYFAPDQPLLSIPQRPQQPASQAPPGRTLGDEVTEQDVDSLLLNGEGPELPGGELEPDFARGRDLGDRTGVTPAKPRKVTGHAPGEYPNYQSFATYNRENRNVAQSDLDRRRLFAQEYNKSFQGETERSSVLRQKLRALLESNEPEAYGTQSSAARASEVAELQRRLRMAERLDTMSGIQSYAPGGE